MYKYFCSKCGCYLDPGEGETCEECLSELEHNRKKELKKISYATIFTKMEINDYLRGNAG
ncbi:MAG: hypothetical protein HDQ95_07435 [Roseburia sp.]|nr:hypothetical protein [Roseburia sp.]